MKDIIEMALKAGFKEHNGMLYVTTINDDCAKELKAFAELVRADERAKFFTLEEARIALKDTDFTWHHSVTQDMVEKLKAIRARGEASPAITAIKEALAQPEQEPVALETVYETIVQWDEGGGKRSRRELARRIAALYTTPPQRTWVGLTDEERFKVAEQTGCMSADWLDVVKATETALQIKNQ